MIRIYGHSEDFVPVLSLSPTRYRIDFDFVQGESQDCGYWSVINYFSKPTTEQVQQDVINGTIARYEAEGLTPPEPQDIDVSEYVIEE